MRPANQCGHRFWCFMWPFVLVLKKGTWHSGNNDEGARQKSINCLRVKHFFKIFRICFGSRTFLQLKIVVISWAYQFSMVFLCAIHRYPGLEKEICTFSLWEFWRIHRINDFKQCIKRVPMNGHWKSLRHSHEIAVTIFHFSATFPENSSLQFINFFR